MLSINHIQSYAAIWTLNIWLIFIIIFLVFIGSISGDLHQGLEFFSNNLLMIIIPFSVGCILISKILSNKITQPIEKLENIVAKFSKNEPYSTTNIDFDKKNSIYEFVAFEKFVQDTFELHKNKHLQDIELSKMATQVAHDIKSPMDILYHFISEEIDPSNRRLEVILKSMNRINEIVNNLLVQYKKIHLKESTLGDHSKIQVELINSIVMEIFEEKKMLFQNQSVNINFANPVTSYFVEINAQNLMIVISNLINNAREAMDEDGRIDIYLEKHFDKIILKISDDGCGMDEKFLSKIESGRTYKKQNGMGLGLSHAFNNIRKWGAEYEIKSQVNKGTEFSIIFPEKERPNWMTSRLYLTKNPSIIIVDDDYSIYEVWKTKFKGTLLNNSLKYLKSPEELEYYSKNNDLGNTIFLIDLHFYNSRVTGLDIVKKLALQTYFTIIVSSNYPNHIMRNILVNENIGFLLKKDIFSIEIVNIIYNPDLILVDDNKCVTETWEFFAKKNNKKIITFNNSNDLFKFIDLFSFHTKIYLDLNLGNENGENIAKNLHDKGFFNLYITTGYEIKDNTKAPWIKGIINKEPPFKKQIDGILND